MPVGGGAGSRVHVLAPSSGGTVNDVIPSTMAAAAEGAAAAEA